MASVSLSSLPISIYKHISISSQPQYKTSFCSLANLSFTTFKSYPISSAESLAPSHSSVLNKLICLHKLTIYPLIKLLQDGFSSSVSQNASPKDIAAAAAAANSLQLCPTLCDIIDGSPPGSPILGILQARTLEWVDARGQLEELRSWQRSWGRMLGLCKGMIKPQETPCSRASNPKTRVCFMLSPTPLTLRGALAHNHFSRRRS